MDNMNSFVKANTMGIGSSMTENGAFACASIGKVILDQFGTAGVCRGREYSTVWAEQNALWNENAELALRFPFYLRLITRKSKMELDDGTVCESEKVQRGQGARDEAFKRLLWIACFHKDEFYRNLWLLPIIGSWKDLWTLMVMVERDALPVEFDLDKEEIFGIIANGIKSKTYRDLIKKYLPRIRSSKKCTTPDAVITNNLAKEFAAACGWSYKDYREFKSTGKAHEFQRIICDRRYDDINWGHIPGIALLKLVSGKFLENHGLTEQYTKWLDAQPVVKFNGYVYELCSKVMNHPSLATIMTVNKQFNSLVKTSSDDDGAIHGNVLCALDTSGSMTCPVLPGHSLSAYDVCISLGVYFSELNKGAFHNVVAMFDDESTLKTLSGSFYDKLMQIRNERTAWGSTNFQSLIDLLIDTRIQHPEIPESEFPETLLVVSDMQFNATGTMESNYQAAISRMREVFSKEYLSEFKIVWWLCTGLRNSAFPSNMDDAGTYMFSGFDPAVVSFLLGGEEIVGENGKKVEKSMEDIIREALNQEMLCLVV